MKPPPELAQHQPGCQLVTAHNKTLRLIGDVRNQCLTWGVGAGVEIAVEVIFKDLGLIIWDRGALICSFLNGGQAHFAHEISDQPDRADNAFFVELGSHPAAASSTTKKGEDPLDFGFQHIAAGLGGGHRVGTSPPGIK